MASFDFKSRFIWLLKTILILGFISAAVYGVLFLGDMVMTRARLVSCEGNLRRLGEALLLYKNQNSEFLPPYLTALYPDYIDDKEMFICPSDPHNGEQGAFPRWTQFDAEGRQQEDWRKEYGFADLDGPTLVPWEDTDDFPCSYYYRFNDYPTDLTKLDEPVTWQQEMEDIARRYGKQTPVVSCLWHLPVYARSSEGVMPNLLINLSETAEYPRDWRLAVEREKKR